MYTYIHAHVHAHVHVHTSYMVSKRVKGHAYPGFTYTCADMHMPDERGGRGGVKGAYSFPDFIMYRILAHVECMYASMDTVQWTMNYALTTGGVGGGGIYQRRGRHI